MPEPWVRGRDGVRVQIAGGSVLFSCPVCEGFGHPLYFATEEDLQIHLRTRICKDRAMNLRGQGFKPHGSYAENSHEGAKNYWILNGAKLGAK